MYQGREQFTLFIQILNIRIENSIKQNMNIYEPQRVPQPTFNWLNMINNLLRHFKVCDAIRFGSCGVTKMSSRRKAASNSNRSNHPFGEKCLGTWCYQKWHEVAKS